MWRPVCDLLWSEHEQSTLMYALKHQKYRKTAFGGLLVLGIIPYQTRTPSMHLQMKTPGARAGERLLGVAGGGDSAMA